MTEEQYASSIQAVPTQPVERVEHPVFGVLVSERPHIWRRVYENPKTHKVLTEAYIGGTWAVPGFETFANLPQSEVTVSLVSA